MSRSLLRSVLELRTPITRLPPAFLLPIRARTLTTTTQNIDPATPPSSISTPLSATAPPSSPSNPSPKTAPPSTAPSPSVTELLPLLRAQPSHYIRVHIHGRAYLVTPGDSIRLPAVMREVRPGDVLRLDRVSLLGSRDYTLKGSPYVDEALFELRAVVLGTESEPLREKIKKKQRTRRAQRVRSKHKYTMLRISELKILEAPTASSA
ncbi:ribosomal protein L21-like protein [Xylariaceae sp. FL0662B]|nr:ribosomal protein L21-like protein [Xylariaceae sp. FL0662B]